MDTTDIPQVLTGTALELAYNSEMKERKALVEGFIYEHTINMMSADPGVGKSTVTAQMAVEMAGGMNVFGIYNMDRPLNVLYIQAERPIIELLERLHNLNKTMPIVKENLYITDAYQRFNLLKPDHVDLFIECINRDCPNADIVIIDPIYPMVSGGLKEDLPASAFTKAMSRVQYELGCALWYNHHTVKSQYASNGAKVEKDDPFYGSQWLKAHVTGSYYLKESPCGVKMVKKKDNYDIMPSSISLDYEPEAGIVSVPANELSSLDKLRNYLHRREIDKKEFSFKDIQDEIKVCTRILRKNLVHSSIKNKLKVVSSIRNKNLYQFLGAENTPK